jgi:predicted dithiol-disulfide oxidoreductase (DUF899 family)
MEIMESMGKPGIAPAGVWQQERDELLKAEKEATRMLDALAARRRRLPMVKFGSGYLFGTSAGPKTLADLFEGRDQLVVYQFMDLGPGKFCPGCTGFTKNVTDLAEAGVSWATVSDMPLAQIEEYKAQMGWTLPFVSSHGTSFSADCGARAENGFMLNVFFRDGTEVYRTYSTTDRGVDRMVFIHNILDVCPYGGRKTGKIPRARTVTGCSARCRTPKTPCRRRCCAPGERCADLRPRCGALVAVCHRDRAGSRPGRSSLARAVPGPVAGPQPAPVPTGTV